HKIEDIEEKYRNQKDKALIWKKQLETANEINVKLKDSVNKLIEKVKSLEDELEKSGDSKKLFDLRINIAELNAELDVYREKNEKYEIEINSLKDEISDLKGKLEIAQTVKNTSSDATIIEEIESLKSKLIEAKKTVKVQRREIVNLHKLLDLS
ncbi:MAG: hypothetical protein ACTSWX_12085, partial [Promethearchaeota archaeon]